MNGFGTSYDKNGVKEYEGTYANGRQKNVNNQYIENILWKSNNINNDSMNMNDNNHKPINKNNDKPNNKNNDNNKDESSDENKDESSDEK